MFTYTQIAEAFIVFMGFLGVALLVINVATGFRNFKKPYEERKEMIQLHEQKLNQDYERINDIHTEMGILLQGQQLIIQHILTDDHRDKLKEQFDFTQRYLIDRRGK